MKKMSMVKSVYMGYHIRAKMKSQDVYDLFPDESWSRVYDENGHPELKGKEFVILVPNRKTDCGLYISSNESGLYKTDSFDKNDAENTLAVLHENDVEATVEFGAITWFS